MQQGLGERTTAHVLPERKRGFYERYIKRLLDIICSLAAIVVFGWLYIILAILVRVKLGPPVLFKQPRPGRIDPKSLTPQSRLITDAAKSPNCDIMDAITPKIISF